LAELDLHTPERGRAGRRPAQVRNRPEGRLRPQASLTKRTGVTAMTTIDYTERIPNNVDLASDRKLQRALESWQPKFLDWWQELAPGAVYLAPAGDVGREGWAPFGHVALPEYRWGIFLAERNADRPIAFGDHKGEPAWQQVPGEHRADLQRLIVVQGDTEPAS